MTTDGLMLMSAFIAGLAVAEIIRYYVERRDE